MKLGFLGAPALAVPLAVFAAAAVAATPPRRASIDEVLAALATRYGEAVVWTGAMRDGVQLVVTANPDGTSWTALMVRPDGVSCLTALGPSWLPGGAAAPAGEEG